ncbi:TPR repeat-containing protein DDB_G0287407-like [Glandiceps talaboti]
MEENDGKKSLRKVQRAISFIHGVRKETKERRIVRVFFSSPFRGLEQERHELTKKYWPRLSSMCSKAGYEFVPVDLRWGITSEKTSNAGTLEVCLREVDRSDLFVGFFGQRYGWNGEKDELLQRSFDVAAIKYPWVNQYRDRSVTELEFLHGHLNHPGNKPACFFFRDKEYDDGMESRLWSSGDDDEASKYTSNTDGASAGQLLNDLKEKVKGTKDKCFEFVEGYADPHTGAALMFEAVKKYLEETVLANPAEEISDREKETLLHNAYYMSRLGVGARREYVGGDEYLKEVDRHVRSDVEGYTDKPLLVLGDPGFGKTTLLANWLHRHKEGHPDDVTVYHFVGCAPRSTQEKDILVRMIKELTLQFEEKCGEEIGDDKSQKDEKNDNEVTKEEDSKKDSSSDPTSSKKKKDLKHRFKDLSDKKTYELLQELDKILQKISDSGKRAVIIIDALNKMNVTHETRKELIWLPTELPKGVSMLVSSLTSDTSKTKVLIEERHWDTLVVGPLKMEDRKIMIKELLALRGKELTPSSIEMIVSKEQTANALYLKTFIQELCNFGDFWRLEDHIQFLMGANSTKELFAKILHGLETDFNSADSKENIISKIMCSILVSRRGVSDQEIKEIANISDHVWSAIFFLMEDFFIDRAGLYDFAYDELSVAVRERYCKDENTFKKKVAMAASFFEKKLNTLGPRYDNETNTLQRIAIELPWHLKKLEEYERLREVLGHLAVFLFLYQSTSCTYDMYGYWNAMEASGSQIASLYTRSIDNQVALMYTEGLERYKESLSPARKLIYVVYSVADFLTCFGHPRHSEPFLKRALKLQKYAYKKEEIYNDYSKADRYINLINDLACLYCELERFGESEELHKENLEVKEKLLETLPKKFTKSDIAVTFNGLALLNQGQRKYDKAMDYYKQSLEMHKATLHENHSYIGTSNNNIGTCLLNQKKYREAIEYFNIALEVYEICYFGSFNTNYTGCLNNLAVCYRNLKELDKAAPLYERSYEATVKALGERHHDTATKLMNYGVFLQHQKKYDEALEKYKKAHSIYLECYGEEHKQTLFVMENMAIAYSLAGREEEGHPYFSFAGETLHKQGRFETTLPGLNRRMLKFYMEKERNKDATKLLERMLDASFAESIHFVALDELDSYLPEDERPKRRYEHTVEYAASRFPKDDDILECLAESTAVRKQTQRMIDILKIGKYESESYNFVYKEYSANDMKREGMKFLTIATEIFPEEWNPLCYLAKAHSELAEYDEAIALLRKAIELHPNDADILESLGKALIAKGETEAGKKELQMALEVVKDDNVKANQIEETLKTLE